MHPPRSGDVSENDVTVLQLNSDRCIGEIPKNLARHLNDVIFAILSE
jgi:hypothetical protein